MQYGGHQLLVDPRRSRGETQDGRLVRCRDVRRAEQVGVPAGRLEVPHAVDLQPLLGAAREGPLHVEITPSATMIESNRLTGWSRQPPALEQPAVLDLGQGLSPSGEIVDGGRDQPPAPDPTLSLERLVQPGRRGEPLLDDLCENADSGPH